MYRVAAATVRGVHTKRQQQSTCMIGMRSYTDDTLVHIQNEQSHTPKFNSNRHENVSIML